MASIDSTEAYVNSIFAKATMELCKFLGSRSNVRGTILHDTQVEYAYIVKNITGGPNYIAPKYVSKIEALVEKIYAFVRDSKGVLDLRDEFSFPITGRTYLWDSHTNTYKWENNL